MCGGRRQGCRPRPWEITLQSQNLAAEDCDPLSRSSLLGGSHGLYNILRGGQAGADGILDREGESRDPDHIGTGGEEGVSSGDDNGNDIHSDGHGDVDSGQSAGDSHAAYTKLPVGFPTDCLALLLMAINSMIDP